MLFDPRPELKPSKKAKQVLVSFLRDTSGQNGPGEWLVPILLPIIVWVSCSFSMLARLLPLPRPFSLRALFNKLGDIMATSLEGAIILLLWGIGLCYTSATVWLCTKDLISRLWSEREEREKQVSDD